MHEAARQSEAYKVVKEIEATWGQPGGPRLSFDSGFGAQHISYHYASFCVSLGLQDAVE